MNRRMIVYSLGLLLAFEGFILLIPSFVALIYKEDVLKYYLATALVLICIGFLLTRIRTSDRMIFSREGMITVALGWIVLSICGAIPFWLSGEIPVFVDAFFEMVSGFTTTGASILSDVESLSHATLLWRSLSHWIGGMGVLVLVISVVKVAAGGGNIHLMRAESPGAEVSKLVPSSKGTAKILYGIYVSLTVLEFVVLLLCRMPVFDAVNTALGTAGTGGFSFRNDSFTSFSPTIQAVVAVFMALFGVNFGCYYLILAGRIKDLFKNIEVRVYFGIMILSTIIIAINISEMYSSTWDAVRHSFFQVSTAMTTTGYTTTDFNMWPELSRTLMLIIMCIGACEGSTGGGLKISRFILLGKIAFREIRLTTKPNVVRPILYNRKVVNEALARNVSSYFILYAVVFVVSLLLISLDGFDTTTNISGVIATLNNIGPGLEAVGATGNYSGYSALSKLVLSANMLFGRLELFPLFILFSHRAWKR